MNDACLRPVRPTRAPATDFGGVDLRGAVDFLTMPGRSDPVSSCER